MIPVATRCVRTAVLSVMLLSLCSGPVWAVVFSVGSTTAVTDQRDTVLPLSVSEREGIVGFAVFLRYDPRLIEVVDVIPVDATEEFSFSMNLSRPGTAKLTALNLDLNVLPSGAGPIAELEVSIAPGGLSAGGSATISATLVELYDANAVKIPVSPVDGKIEIVRRSRQR
jgi:hypothetical protein